MAAVDAIAPPPGFVDEHEIPPPDGFVDDVPVPDGFVEETPASATEDAARSFIQTASQAGAIASGAMFPQVERAAKALNILKSREVDEAEAEADKPKMVKTIFGEVPEPTPDTDVNLGLAGLGTDTFAPGGIAHTALNIAPLEGAIPRSGNAGVDALSSNVEGLVTPLNALFAIGLGGAPAAIQKAGAAYFGVEMGKGAIEQGQEAYHAIKEGDYDKAGAALVNAGVGGLMTAAAGAHVKSDADFVSLAKTREIISKAPDEALAATLSDPQLVAKLHETAPELVASEIARRQEAALRTVAPLTAEAVKAELPAAPSLETPSAEKSTQEPPTAPATAEATREAVTPGPEYVGGPGAMGPVEAGEMHTEGGTTGLKRAVVDVERLTRGEPEIPTVERQREDALVREAEDRVDSDPTHAPALVEKIVDKGERGISEQDAATLLVERQRVMNERNQWEERLGRGEDVEVARERIQQAEEQLNRLDQAQRSAGSTWGRVGHLYQRMIREDFTLDAMERKARAAKGGALTEGERATIKEQADKISELQKEVERGQQAESEAMELQKVAQTYEATIADLQKGQKFGAQVFEIARKVVERWKAEAAEVDTNIRDFLGSESGAIGEVGGSGKKRFLGDKSAPQAKTEFIKSVALKMRAAVGEKGLNFAEASAELVSTFGEKIKPYLQPAWDKAQQLIGKEKDPKVKSAIRQGVTKPKAGEQLPEAIRTLAKAASESGGELSHKTVYDLARAHINAGVHGENAVMKAVHEDLKQLYPDLTEREVRRAFSEYGEVKFPSKEADKVELRELRTLVRLQESIDRETAGLEAMHTGLQRDKATQAIREKQKQLNELLKKREGPPSPEKLASRNEARKTALKNQIEDLDKRLRTGEKPPVGAKPMDSIEVEQLKAERDAMREKLHEIEVAEKVRPTEEEAYNATRQKVVKKRIAELQARIAKGDYTRKAKPVTPTKTQATKDAEFALAKEKKTFNEGLFQQQIKNRTTGQKIIGAGAEALNLARAIKTSFDLSAVGRQGAFIGLGNPIRSLRAIPAMLKAARSEKGQFEINNEIKSRPNASLYEEAKLYLHDPHEHSLSKMEEAYMSRLASKIPGVSHSERAYTTFLNRLRADSFDAMQKSHKESHGRDYTPDEAMAIANFINVATGRGNLFGSSPSAAVGFNTLLFSPRYLSSRIELLAGAPLYSRKIVNGKSVQLNSALTRKAIAAEYAKSLSGLAVVLGLAALAGAQIDIKNPTSPDFLKTKIGNTRLDFLGGTQQNIVFSARAMDAAKRFAMGQTQRENSEFLGRFVRSKLSPAAGLAMDISTGKDFKGDPVTRSSAALGMVQPMIVDDVVKAMQDQGVPRGTAISILILMGISTQTYKKRD